MNKNIINLGLYGLFAVASLFGVIANIVPIVKGLYLESESLSLGQYILFGVVFLVIFLLAVRGFIRIFLKTKQRVDPS